MTPTVLTLARRSMNGETKVPRGAALLVAVSGGPDSMALLHVLARLAPELGLAVHAHGVDHGLRADAARELDLAAQLAERLAIPFRRSVVHVGRGGNLQARARRARYEALAAAAHEVGAAAIATAHHADDRAETLLLRLMRGAGPQGLAVLPPRAPLGSTELELLRPLLRVRRVSIQAHAERHRLPFATDPSNADPRFLRTRVRRELIPLLVELAPGIVEHLVALADQLAPLDGSATSSYPLPRATQVALAGLVRSRSPTARVWLPGGLVAALDPQAGQASERRPRRGRD